MGGCAGVMYKKNSGTLPILRFLEVVPLWVGVLKKSKGKALLGDGVKGYQLQTTRFVLVLEPSWMVLTGNQRRAHGSEFWLANLELAKGVLSSSLDGMAPLTRSKN